MIDPKLQSEIKKALEGYRTFTPIKLADELGIKIVFSDVSEDPNFSGAIKKVEGDGTVIFVNKDDSEKRQLFTIAHELGHFFLHQSDIEKGIVSYRHALLYAGYTPAEKKKEEEANHFAAELLMPENTFVEYFTKNSSKKMTDLVSEMARFFGVSEDAIRMRISYLDLLKLQ